MSSTINPEIVKLLSFFDTISCGIFLYDWKRRYNFASNKIKYSLLNLPDLIASIPFFIIFDYIGYLKVFRLITVIKVIKTFGGVNRIVYYLRNNEIHSLKLLFSILFMLVIIGSPILILYVEIDKGNIKTAEHALWWSYCTLTTIGYGDFYPTTTIGRLLAVLVSIGGISLFGLLITTVTEHLKNDEKNKDNTSS